MGGRLCGCDYTKEELGSEFAMRRSVSTGPTGETTGWKGKRMSGEGVFDEAPECRAERLRGLLLAHWRGYKARQAFSLLRSEFTLSPYFTPDLIHQTLRHAKASILRTHSKHTYMSGAVYEGEWRGGFRDGQGKMLWTDGAQFIGKWSWGWPVGIGRFEGPEGEVFEGKWGSPFDVGRTSWCMMSSTSLNAWTGSQANGYCKLYSVWLWYRERRKDISPSSASIDQALAHLEAQFSRLEAMLASLRPRLGGELGQSELGKAGLRATRQVLYDEAGAVYTGELDGDIHDGIGRLVCTNGDSYQGEWKAGQRSGFGISRWRDGSHYIGFFRSDLRWGPGEYHATDGSVRIGEWSEDMMNGTGMQTWEDGRRYLGQWREGRKEGVGCMVDRDRSEARGMWVEGKKNGVFRVSLQGIVRTEKWQRGRKVAGDM